MARVQSAMTSSIESSAHRLSVSGSVPPIGCGSTSVRRSGSPKCCDMLFETDFPHPTCQHPGPRTPAMEPRRYAEEVLGDLPEATIRKVLFENAAQLYSVDLSPQREAHT